MRSAQNGDERAKIVNRLLATRERLIGAILLGNNVATIVASSLATGILLLWFGEVGIFYATAIMAVVIVVFSEVMPKTVAINHPDRVSLMIARPIYWIVRVLAPITIAIEKIVGWSLRLFGLRLDTTENVLSGHEELRGTVDLLHHEGEVKKDDRDMFGGLLDLRELEVSDVMIHRTKMATINADDPPEKIVSEVLASAYTRLPIWRGTPENIVGVIHAKDLLRELDAVGGDESKIDIAAIALEPWFVPDTTSLADQLKAFRKRKTHFALVVDEYGEVMGLVTLEDIIEEIVGDISDEHDVSVSGLRAAGRRLGHRRWRRADPRPQPRDGLEFARRGSDHDRGPRHPRGAADPRAGTDLHLSRLPLSGAAKDAQPHHRVEGHALEAPRSEARGTGGMIIRPAPALRSRARAGRRRSRTPRDRSQAGAVRSGSCR